MAPDTYARRDFSPGLEDDEVDGPLHEIRGRCETDRPSADDDDRQCRGPLGRVDARGQVEQGHSSLQISMNVDI